VKALWAEEDGVDLYDGVIDEEPRAAGGHGSGFFGHAGRPGEVGGSADGGENTSKSSDAPVRSIKELRRAFRHAVDKIEREKIQAEYQQAVGTLVQQRGIEVGIKSDPATLEALRIYGSSDVGRALNESLRTGTSFSQPSSSDPVDSGQVIRELDGAMTYDGPAEVAYRNVAENETFAALKPGDSFTDNGYVSTTRDQTTLKNFGEGGKFAASGKIMRVDVHIPAGYPRIDRERYDKVTEMIPWLKGGYATTHLGLAYREVVLARGTRFVVESNKGGKLVLKAVMK